jgi:tetratricopeptide (TPR) repeat protein
VVLKALEREPARRYQHASEVKTGVETITSTSQGAAPVTNASPNLAPKQLPGSDTTWVVLFAVEMVLTLGLGAFLLQIVPAVGFVWILAVFLVASYQLNSRKEIQRARESGMWPQLGEVPALEHVKRLAQAGKKVLAIKLYRQMHGASLADAKAAVEKLTVQSAPPRDPKAQPPAAPPLVAPKPDHFWRKVVVVVLALIAIPFVVAFVGLLAAITIPNFVKARDQSQKNATQQSDKEGWQLWQAGNFDAAQKKFSQVVEKLDPANVEAWNGLGWTWLNAGQPLAAETNFQKALSLEATCPGALNGLGRLYLLQRNYEEGEKYLLQAAPTQHAAWDGLSRLYLLDGKFDSAAEWAQKLVDSGNADDTARQMLQAAREKHVSDDLRRIVEKPTHDLNDTH